MLASFDSILATVKDGDIVGIIELASGLVT